MLRIRVADLPTGATLTVVTGGSAYPYANYLLWQIEKMGTVHQIEGQQAFALGRAVIDGEVTAYCALIDYLLETEEVVWELGYRWRQQDLATESRRLTAYLSGQGGSSV